jgi:hypothetical protein
MRTPLALAFLATVFFGVPASPALATGRAEPREFTLTIAAGKVHEECLKLERNERRRYTWKTDVPVDFNIHYHEGSEVFYPTKRDNNKRGRGTFKAKIAQEYCWMWSAKAPTKLEGRIR